MLVLYRTVVVETEPSWWTKFLVCLFQHQPTSPVFWVSCDQENEIMKTLLRRGTTGLPFLTRRHHDLTPDKRRKTDGWLIEAQTAKTRLQQRNKVWR